MKSLKWYMLLLSVLLVRPVATAGQDKTEASKAATQETPEIDPAAKRLDELDQKLDAQSSRIATLEKEKEEATQREKAREEEAAKLKEELNQTKQDLEDFSMLGAETPDERKLSVYGFFDTTFYKAWQKKGSSLLTVTPPYSTFMMSGVNLYFKSQMTESIEALVEAGLSFSPLGYESAIPSDAYVDGELNEDLSSTSRYPYARTDTTVPGGVITQTVRYGSVSILRAYLDWKPRDWLKFRIGRYITPYGIWNEEHASTVLIGVFQPDMINGDLVPPSQLGVQIFGSLFPADIFQLDYAVTLSNGRGPIDTIMDLDENKAVGLRLQAILSINKWKLTAGGYGYYGTYSDVERHATVSLNSDLSLDYSNGSPIGGTILVTEKYKEWAGATNLTLELYGVKLFGEYVYRRLEYLIQPDMFSAFEVIQNGNSKNRKAASHLSQSVYGILAWTLPIQMLLPVQITPYAGFDWINPDDSIDWFQKKSTRFGLNVKPSPFVVLKAEGIVDIFDELVGGKMTSLAIQVAVSF